MLALIDGDFVCYRAAASCEPTKTKSEREPERIAIYRAIDTLERILRDLAPEEYRLFIGGVGNFRDDLYPAYKAHRRTVPRPEHLDAVREFLVREWNAEIVSGYETDDAIAMSHTGDTIICSNDKDFQQLVGKIYNPTKSSIQVVTPTTASFAFYSQMLIGDTSDNVRGVDGIGPVKSRNALWGLTPLEMYHAVRELYGEDERFFCNLRLFRLLRSDQEAEQVVEAIRSGHVGEYLQWFGESIKDEATISESEGSQPPEENAGQDSGDISGVNNE